MAMYGLIFYLSSLPGSSLPTGIPDVIPHAGEYLLLALAVVYAFRGVRAKRFAAFMIILLLFLAAADEAHQYFVPGRHCSWLDLLYDFAGIGAGLALGHRLFKLPSGSRSPRSAG